MGRPPPDPGWRRRSTLALAPVFITRAIEATPFPSAPNVVVSYPHREDWWNRYPALRREGGRKRNIDEFEWLYQDSKRSYQESVLKRLRKIQHWATGRAVLAELRARPSYSVCIFPWDFLPSIDRKSRDALGLVEALQIPQTPRERARGIKPPGTKYHERGVYSASMDRPGAVDVFYTDYRCEESEADGVLLHELLHASRVTSGVFHQSRMGGGYRNSEEFLRQYDRDDLSIRDGTGRLRLCVSPYRSGNVSQAAQGARVAYGPSPRTAVALSCAGESGCTFQPDKADRSETVDN